MITRKLSLSVLFVLSLFSIILADPIKNNSGSEYMEIRHYGFLNDGNMWIRFKDHSSGVSGIRYGYKFSEDYNMKTSPEKAKAMVAFLVNGINNSHKFTVWIDSNGRIGHIVYQF